jgi:signal transduction histidine kinase
VSATRRLSLRARLLVMLVGVTTVLLVVMGTVSSYLLAHLVDGQISQATAVLREHIANLAKGCPSTSSLCLNAYSAGDAVVLVPLQPHLQAVPVTSGSLSRRLTAAVNGQLAGADLRGIRKLAQQGELTAVSAAVSGAGCPARGAGGGTAGGAGAPDARSSFPYLNCAPFVIDSARQIQTATRLVTAGPAGPIAPASSPARQAILFVAQPVSNDPGLVREFIVAQLITGAALITLLAVIGEWLIGRGLEPLDEMAAAASEITSIGDLTARMPDADDQTEVGRLGAAINTMLERIQQAFSMRLHSEHKVREFAADASHELRTPLTTIRGYAELYRQGALGPDQLPSAMRRIEQEAQRMSTLVAELLELARLDRTSSLDLTETDLAAVVRDAVADAVAVQPDRPVRAEAPPRLVAVVDEPRVRQVIANLLGNVRAHTPPTTPVAVRLGAISGGVLIEVADAGPGMSAPDAIRAFDRFHRAADRGSWSAPAEPGHGPGEHNGHGPAEHGSQPPGGLGSQPPGGRGGQQPGGSGLGLSIVQAIATAHGGQATLESRPGKGTKVRVWLPVRVVS